MIPGARKIGEMDQDKPLRHIGNLTDAEKSEVESIFAGIAEKYNLAFCVYGQSIDDTDPMESKVTGHHVVGQGYLCEYIKAAIDTADALANAILSMKKKDARN